MSRRINLDTPVLPDPQRTAWLEANGIDPRNVPAAQEVLIENGQLTFVEFVRSADNGALLIEDDHYLKVLRAVPLISPPEEHNL